MSVVLSYSPEQVGRWAQRGPEPLSLELDGWEVTEYLAGRDDILPNERLQELRRGGRKVSVRRFWDSPLTGGYPMATASTREVQVAGHALELVTTSMFEGFEQRVDVLFVRGVDWLVRIVFEGCSAVEVDAICQRIELHAPLGGGP